MEIVTIKQADNGYIVKVVVPSNDTKRRKQKDLGNRISLVPITILAKDENEVKALMNMYFSYEPMMN